MRSTTVAPARCSFVLSLTNLLYAATACLCSFVAPDKIFLMKDF